MGTIPFESQPLARCLRYAPTLNSGEAHRAALVILFVAARTLAVRSSRLSNMPQPSATKRLPHGAP